MTFKWSVVVEVAANLRVKSDKHPADYCVIFDGSEVISVFDFVVGTCALSE
jgi:hypothetical protein